MTIADAADAIIGDIAVPYVLISSATRYIGTLVFDVTVREVHSDEFTITDSPTELGAPSSDHIFANPKVVEITCASSDSTAGVTGYVLQVYEAMQALAATREVFDVSTGKRFYQNMFFSNFTVVTDDQSEFALMVTARLRELIITSTSSTATASGSGGTQASQADPASTAPEASAGAQALQPAPSVTLPAGVGNDAGITAQAVG
ncbi:MAG: hypothetical protein P4M05_28450 [Bradyrhizobium sp.]|nr:hypothetical protein [Bradyrhizobium sp.]